MISIRTPWWAAAVLSLPLALAIGCGTTEDTTSTPSPTPSTTPTTTTTPAPSTPTTTDTKKDMEPATATPAPAKDESPKVEAPKVEAPKVEAPAKDTPKGASAVKLSDEEVAAIKKLPAGEQDLALKQAVCPVSGKHLGSMDAPFKVTAAGKTFYLCCDGCKETVDADAKAVVAKLPK